MAKRGGQKLGVGGGGVSGTTADMQPDYAIEAPDTLGASPERIYAESDEDTLSKRAQEWNKRYDAAGDEKYQRQDLTVSGVSMNVESTNYDDNDIKRVLAFSGAKKGQHVDVRYSRNGGTTTYVYDRKGGTLLYQVTATSNGGINFNGNKFALQTRGEVANFDRVIKGAKAAKADHIKLSTSAIGTGTEITTVNPMSGFYTNVPQNAKRGAGANSKFYEAGFHFQGFGAQVYDIPEGTKYTGVLPTAGGLAKNSTKTAAGVNALKAAGFNENARIENVVRTPAGREWFKKFGSEPNVSNADWGGTVIFSLKEGGYSMKRWNEFKKRYK